MPSRLLQRQYTVGHTYHILHTAAPGRSLFPADTDAQNFLLLLSYYLRFPDATPLSWVKRLSPQTVIGKRDASTMGSHPVSLHGFLLLPGHFHLVVRENLGGGSPGVSNLMRRLSVGYAMYYNKAHSLQGTIYRGKYKNLPLTEDGVAPLVDALHHHPGINDTYLNLPLHSSRSDYAPPTPAGVTPRPWITPLTVPDSPPPISPKLLLCHAI